MIPPYLVKARLEQIAWNQDNQAIEVPNAKKIPVQFNPDSLKVSLSNQTSGGDQRGGAAIQFVGAGTTKLSFDLWFDVTNPEHNTRQVGKFIPDDVRLLTQEVAFFIKPKKDKKDKKKFIPPGVRLLWGRFLFEGIMESLNEEISYFSEDGRPLRAKLSVSLMRQEIQFLVPEGKPRVASSASSRAPGATPATPPDPDAPREEARQDDTVADLAGAAGNPESWPAVAAANGIENPRSLAPGTVLDVSASAGFSAGASFGAGASLSAGAGAVADGGFSAGASAGASAGFNAGASAGAGASFGGGASAGGALGGGLRAGVAASAGGGVGASAGAGFGAGTSAGIGGGIGGSFGAGAGGSFGAGASAGFGSGIGSGAFAGLGGGTASLSFEGAAGSASARANAAFDLSLRR